jgi:hypothetical protein
MPLLISKIVIQRHPLLAMDLLSYTGMESIVKSSPFITVLSA